MRLRNFRFTITLINVPFYMLQISGDHNEKQILVAAQAYQERPEVLTKVLNDLYHLLRFENCCDISRALTAVLTAMDRHLACKHIQISGR